MPGHIQCTGTVNFNIVLLNNEIENYIIKHTFWPKQNTFN